jgi:DNA-binding NarL/FixJ family response regulator
MLLTAMLSAASIDEARRIGAAGFLSKTEDPGNLLQALRTVASGGTAWCGDDGGWASTSGAPTDVGP